MHEGNLLSAAGVLFFLRVKRKKGDKSKGKHTGRCWASGVTLIVQNSVKRLRHVNFHTAATALFERY